MSDHSLLSPSGAHRWLYCVASVRRCKGMESVESDDAAEGTRAHEIAAGILAPKNPTQAWGTDSDTIHYIMDYVNRVKEMTANAEYSDYEVPLDLSRVLGIAGEKGTADCIAIIGKELQVHDLKFGRGVAVDAYENTQMSLYALGALEIAELLGYEIETIRMCIHQPRISNAEKFSEWVTPVQNVKEFGRYAMEQARKAMALYQSEALPPPEYYKPGEKQCRWCLAKAECEARLKWASDDIADDFGIADECKSLLALSSDGAVDRSEVYAKLLPKLAIFDVIAERVKEVWKEAHGYLMNGGTIEGYKLVIGKRGNRKWKDTKRAEEIMRSMRLKVDEMYDMEIISPASAEKMLKKSPRKWKRLVELISQEEGKPTIAEANDSRPAYVNDTCVDDFTVEEELSEKI